MLTITTTWTSLVNLSSTNQALGRNATTGKNDNQGVSFLMS